MRNDDKFVSVLAVMFDSLLVKMTIIIGSHVNTDSQNISHPVGTYRVRSLKTSSSTPYWTTSMTS